MASVSLVMISCDAEATVGRAIDSLKEYVDEILVVDTGSEDATRDVAKKAGARVVDFNCLTHPDSFVEDVPENWTDPSLPGPYTGKMRLCDFAAARQFGWELASSDYIVWIDSDDVMEGGHKISEVIADMEMNGIDAAMLNYDYSQDEKGNVTLRLQRERIVKRGIFHWEQPVHEVLVPSGNRKFYGEPNVVHLRDRDKLAPLWHHRNLKILYRLLSRSGMSLDAADARVLFYLGLEQRWLHPSRAIESFKAYLKKSGWDEERAAAHCAVGKILENGAEYSEALSHYALATMEFERNPDGLFGAARCAYYLAGSNSSLWTKVVEWTERAFQTAKASQQVMLMEDAYERKWRPHVFLSVALLNTNNVERCIEICELGLQAHSTEPYLLGNLKRSGEILNEKNGVKEPGQPQSIDLKISEPLENPPLSIPPEVLGAFALQMWKRLETGNERRKFLSSLPREVASLSKIKEAASFFGGREKKLKIGIWTGPAWESWTPDSVNQGGIGGSETATVHMANELAELGHDVTVFAVCSGLYGKVTYVEHDKQKQFDGDVFISSRQPWVLLEKWWKARRSYLWVHDVHAGVSQEAIEAISLVDGVFALSKWHAELLKSTYPKLDERKIFVTRNGIDASRFAPSENIHLLKSEKPRLIYASSPDRGLSYLLDLLPSIQREVKDVELNVYYGFSNWLSMAKASGDQRQIREAEDLQRKIQNTAGVNARGRVGQRDLAKSFLESHVWAYPTWFTETSCITAMEAQAAGCVPVTSDLAALSETVKEGILIREPLGTAAYGDAFVEAVVDLLKNENGIRSRLSTLGRAHALNHLSWARVAQEWTEKFAENSAGKEGTETMMNADLGQLFEAIGDGNVQGIKPKERITVLDIEKPPLRFAVMYGVFSSGIHGKFDIPSLWERSGLTGSESCFFNMAKALSEQGHQVDVFCDTVASYRASSELAGAHVYPIRSTWPDKTYDVYMAWNEPDLLRSVPSDKLRVCFQQLNDFASYSAPGFDECVDVYVLPSNALKNHLVATERMSASKVCVLPNSINLDFYEKEYQRGKTIVWCSSPDRGLHVLLPIFEEVRKRISDVTLKIFYRYDKWVEDNSRYPGSECYGRAMEIEAHLSRVGRSGENGVIMFDSVSNRRMARELLSAKAFAYTCEPVRFTEGFSVSIMDACAAGCVPIISDADALPEIYGGAAHIIPGHPSQKKEEWVEALSRVFLDESFSSRVSARTKSFAANFGRKDIASQLVEIVREKKGQKK